jgi:hypothetical protein
LPFVARGVGVHDTYDAATPRHAEWSIYLLVRG